ncbi:MULTISPECIES: hypothetical protein [unclassified Arenibacter]|uniref:hypothetical protein n=1 Tax=unclassified Arenibacter TaxID=2615047 RepID=UPI000E347B8D|nr:MULTISPECIES: hypothetical protein [unclassified Arenibacter]MCM4163625.1 hypothetical protein [Arenibacter sp. A80]RFT56352.1 hypothetical protein D0S24_08440 [Arenibacter sp. P308M17]
MNFKLNNICSTVQTEDKILERKGNGINLPADQAGSKKGVAFLCPRNIWDVYLSGILYEYYHILLILLEVWLKRT